jgi:hypothetical protein
VGQLSGQRHGIPRRDPATRCQSAPAGQVLGRRARRPGRCPSGPVGCPAAAPAADMPAVRSPDAPTSRAWLGTGVLQHQSRLFQQDHHWPSPIGRSALTSATAPWPERLALSLGLLHDRDRLTCDHDREGPFSAHSRLGHEIWPLIELYFIGPRADASPRNPVRQRATKPSAIPVRRSTV